MNVSTISTQEIKDDIEVTQLEIDGYIRENTILNINPQRNRVKIYMNNGAISQREDFINKLNNILDDRKMNNQKVYNNIKTIVWETIHDDLTTKNLFNIHILANESKNLTNEIMELIQKRLEEFK